MSFMGLPGPAAAGVIVSLIIFHQETLPELLTKDSRVFVICESAIMYALPFLTLGIAVLMVSRIRYPHVLNQYIKGQKPFSHLIWLLLGLGVVIWNIQVALVLIFCGFAAGSFVKWLYYKVIRKGGPILSTLEQVAEWESEK
jgi:CDP-diacylglycerol--serine O-phosphatidyltransferase